MDIIGMVGGRKAALTIGVLATGAATVYLKGDIPVNYLALLQTVFGAFVAGNVGEHVVGAFRKPEPGAISAPGVDTEALEAQTAEWSERINTLQQGVQLSNDALKFVVDKLNKLTK